MVERQKRPFLDRRDYAGLGKSGKIKLNPQKSYKQAGEFEIKLKQLYEGLDTGFWGDDTPKKIGKSKKTVPSKIVKRLTRLKVKLASVASRLHAKVMATGRAKYIYSLVPALVALTVTGVLLIAGSGGTPAPTKGVDMDNVGYKPILPSSTDALHSKAVQGLKYLPDKKVFSYVDTISAGKGAIISQQPLPPQYNDDPETGLKKVASDLGAVEWFATSKGKAYSIEDPTGKGQTVVFTYKSILVFMRAAVPIDQQAWEDYIDSLTQ